MTHPALAILDAGLVRRAAVPCRLVFAGSSTTAGSGATAKAARYVDQLVAAIQRAYPSGLGVEQPVVDSESAEFGTLSTAAGVHGYNAGEGGTTSAGYLTQTEAEAIAAVAPVAVFHGIGSNDYAATDREPDEFRANVEGVLDAIDAELAAPCLHVLVHQQRRRDMGYHAGSWAEFGSALKAIADARPDRVLFVDASQAFDTLDCFRTDPYGLGKTDDIHLTDAGHALLAATVLRALGIAQVGTGSEFLPGQRIATMTPRTTPIGSAGTGYIVSQTVLDSVTADLVAGHTYHVRWLPHIRPSAADGNVQLKLLEDDINGATLQTGRVHCVGMVAGVNDSRGIEADYTAAATGPKTFVGTAQRASGSADIVAHAGSTNPVQLYVDYVKGPAT